MKIYDPSIDYVSSIAQLIDEVAPYQSVLLLHDFSAPARVINVIHDKIKSRCIVSKMLVSSSHANAISRAEDAHYRLIIVVGESHTLSLIRRYSTPVLFVATDYDITYALEYGIDTLFDYDIISENMSAERHASHCTLSAVSTALVSAKFYSILSGDRQHFSIITTLHSLLCSRCRSLTNDITASEYASKLFEIYQIVSDTTARHGIKLHFYECHTDEFGCLCTHQKLHFYDSLVAIYMDMLVSTHSHDALLIDFNKYAKSYGAFTQQYFNTIDFFHDILSDPNSQLIFTTYYNAFISTLSESLDLIGNIVVEFEMFYPSEPHTYSALSKVYQCLLDRFVTDQNRHLLTYAKMYSIF